MKSVQLLFVVCQQYVVLIKVVLLEEEQLEEQTFGCMHFFSNQEFGVLERTCLTVTTKCF